MRVFYSSCLRIGRYQLGSNIEIGNTVYSQARIQRGAQGARAPPDKSQLTLLVFILGQFFGQIPQIFAARFGRRRGTVGGRVGVMRLSRKKFLGPCLYVYSRVPIIFRAQSTILPRKERLRQYPVIFKK